LQLIAAVRNQLWQRLGIQPRISGIHLCAMK
jgi:hypothetical protein